MRTALRFLIGLAVLGAPACSRSPTAVPAPGPAPDAAGPVRIERVADAERYFHLVEVVAVLFRYSGGPIDVWVEVAAVGRPARKVFLLHDKLRDLLTSAKLSESDVKSGHLLLVRRPAGAEETWAVKLTVDRTDGGELGVRAVASVVALTQPLQGFVRADNESVTGETSLLTLTETTPAGDTIVRLMCGPLKASAGPAVREIALPAQGQPLGQPVDFTKEHLLLFQWEGSAYDKLSFDVEQDAAGRVAAFRLKVSPTKDYAYNVRLFAVPNDTRWRIAQDGHRLTRPTKITSPEELARAIPERGPRGSRGGR